MPHALAATLPCLLLAVPATATPPPLPAEHLTVQQLPPRSPHWVYVFDQAFFNETDARVHLYDGDNYRRLGQIDAGFLPAIAISPDGSTTAVATTYFARGGHGTRTDVVEFTDNTTLGVTGEIVLPAKLSETTPTLFSAAYSADGHFLYTAYITPAASFGVLDPLHRTVLSEIPTAGCVLVIPSGTNRVSSLCDSGRLLTVTLDAHGHEASRAMSSPFFDVATDPVFVQGIRSTRGFTFLSFLGEVHDVDFTGAQPAFAPPWSLVGAAEKGVWRPGAQQVGAIHRALGRLYVPMHMGGEGTHKDGGTEIWVFELATHKRVARWPLQPQGLSRIVAIQVSQDAAPLLFAATDTANVAVFDARSGELRHVEKHLGQTPWMLLNP
ncbi:MAG TPA: amine dehydrogenase large subunit [Steroidobacteraceae bacterium]|nr:amine dehydrogenase large subunit [Steroidobacteraceae bacterium]